MGEMLGMARWAWQGVDEYDHVWDLLTLLDHT